MREILRERGGQKDIVRQTMKKNIDRERERERGREKDIVRQKQTVREKQ